jgi:TolA-binding protein
LIKDYGDLPVMEEALYLLGRTYEATGKLDRAKETLEQLLVSYPNSAYQERAKEQLARLNGHST